MILNKFIRQIYVIEQDHDSSKYKIEELELN